jgi:methionyl-tRNA formyltransferase
VIIFLGNKNVSKYSDLINESKRDAVDLVVSCQYPHKVPESLLASHICVNIHYGVLPFYAGMNPIYWQIMRGSTAGVTLHYMDNKFDSGDIIDIYEFGIADKTADEVYSICEEVGVGLLSSHYRSILDGTAPRRQQDITMRQYYGKDDVDFAREAQIGRVFLNERAVMATHFPGKQLPVVMIGGREYELRAK